eukprot:TRINITY_DN20889_c0_g1_i4.p1 TRINITY_DN20889_c0_g1~~TRINITY_DN20889_c0_g1_i4.p1  ORF type:complete len:197 (-),score=52.69 TRINITY_DN20889_c0_g1_i4:251-841(-)
MGTDLLQMSKRVLRGRKVVLGGTSMGAATSLFAALEDPSSVSALILANPPTCYETRAKFVPLYRESLELASGEGLEAAKVSAQRKARPGIFLETESGRATFDIGWKAKFKMGLERYKAALQGAIHSDLPSQDELRNLQVPTLIIAWKTDAQHPMESAELLCETLPNAELHVAENWAAVKELPQEMRAFLKRIMDTE